MMVDDKFSLWDLKTSIPDDESILAKHGLMKESAGAGAADPKAIDFQWHQRNFEVTLLSIEKGVRPSVDGAEGRKAVELITAIYQSIREGGSKITL